MHVPLSPVQSRSQAKVPILQVHETLQKLCFVSWDLAQQMAAHYSPTSEHGWPIATPFALIREGKIAHTSTENKGPVAFLLTVSKHKLS